MREQKQARNEEMAGFGHDEADEMVVVVVLVGTLMMWIFSESRVPSVWVDVVWRWRCLRVVSWLAELVAHALDAVKGDDSSSSVPTPHFLSSSDFHLSKTDSLSSW